MNVLALCASPRADGNSRTLAEAAAAGVREAGHDVEIVQLSDHVTDLLRDCRRCRRPDGSCSIDDGYRELLLERFIPADAVIWATPLWWYGVSGYLKTFLDRMFCYVADSYPDAAEIVARLQSKRVALLISSEESYVGSRLGVLASFHELERYMDWPIVGVVDGIGNRRGEVARDPQEPLEAARRLGRTLFDVQRTNYLLATERSGTVWPG